MRKYEADGVLVRKIINGKTVLAVDSNGELYFWTPECNLILNGETYSLSVEKFITGQYESFFLKKILDKTPVTIVWWIPE